jgi:hypothetical protein
MTVLFSMITFTSLLVLFGIFTWLPHLVRSSGYELGSALIFLMVLNLATAGSFLLAVVGIAVLSIDCQCRFCTGRSCSPESGPSAPRRSSTCSSPAGSTGLPLQGCCSRPLPLPAVIGAVLVTVMPARRTAAGAKRFLFDA